MRANVWKLLLLAVVVLLLVSGCAESEGEPDGDDGQGIRETQPQSTEAAEGDVGEDTDSDGVVGNDGDVLMIGRSVTEGLFLHWGWDWDGPLSHVGRTFSYHSVSGPPRIGEEAVARIDQAPDGTIVFFKLCFVDFWADNDDDIEYLLSENLVYVDEVLDAVRGRDIMLILGNALPKVRGETTSALVELHRAYNEALDGRAATADNVVVFDQYSLLVEADGSLRDGFAVSSSDSHLNSDAYDAYDAELLALLDDLE